MPIPEHPVPASRSKIVKETSNLEQVEQEHKNDGNGIIQSGGYVISKVVNEEGYSLIWEKSLVLRFTKMDLNLLLRTPAEVGKVWSKESIH